MLRVNTIKSKGQSSDIKIRIEVTSKRLSRDEVDIQVKEITDQVMRALSGTIYHRANLCDMEVK